MAVNYSILCDVELDTKNIQKQLNKAKGEIKIGVDSKGLKQAGKDMAHTMLTYQAAHAVFAKSVDAMKAMIDEIYELDKAQIEFQKISDLSDQAMDDYVASLARSGREVARTGKPKRQAPNVGMVNQH